MSNPRKYRLFQYADCCVQARKVIDLVTAIGRGMVEIDGRGVCRVSDDVCELGEMTERGWKRTNPEIWRAYFGD